MYFEKAEAKAPPPFKIWSRSWPLWRPDWAGAAPWWHLVREARAVIVIRSPGGSVACGQHHLRSGRCRWPAAVGRIFSVKLQSARMERHLSIRLQAMGVLPSWDHYKVSPPQKKKNITRLIIYEILTLSEKNEVSVKSMSRLSAIMVHHLNQSRYFFLCSKADDNIKRQWCSNCCSRIGQESNIPHNTIVFTSTFHTKLISLVSQQLLTTLPLTIHKAHPRAGICSCTLSAVQNWMVWGTATHRSPAVLPWPGTEQ